MRDDYGWIEATREATEAGDTVRLRTLAVVSAALLDLVPEMSTADWTRMYGKVSERMEIRKKKIELKLMNDD